MDERGGGEVVEEEEVPARAREQCVFIYKYPSEYKIAIIVCYLSQRVRPTTRSPQSRSTGRERETDRKR